MEAQDFVSSAGFKDRKVYTGTLIMSHTHTHTNMTTEMGPQGIMLCELSAKGKDKYCVT